MFKKKSTSSTKINKPLGIIFLLMNDIKMDGKLFDGCMKLLTPAHTK